MLAKAMAKFPGGVSGWVLFGYYGFVSFVCDNGTDNVWF